MEIQKIQMVVLWLYRRVESLFKLLTTKKGAFWFTNKRVQIKILSILKLVSFESLARNDFFERCTQAGGSLRKKPQLPTVKYF